MASTMDERFVLSQLTGNTRVIANVRFKFYITWAQSSKQKTKQQQLQQQQHSRQSKATGNKEGELKL